MTAPDRTQAAAPWPASPRSPAPRGRISADLVYLGWQQAQREPDPGPPPGPPVMTDPDEVNPDWVAAQRREQSRLSRPARLTALACLALAGAALAGRLGRPDRASAGTGCGTAGDVRRRPGRAGRPGWASAISAPSCAPSSSEWRGGVRSSRRASRAAAAVRTPAP